MSKFLNTTNRTIVWFKKANDNGDLQMTPPFQRNPVWTTSQKSYLIDSILNGFPIPEIYMQEFVDEGGNEQHIIIDGQQRIRACLEFVEGRYEIKADESPSWGDMNFDDLSADDKKKVFGYTFIVRILPEMSDEDIRGIFQRLNKNVVALNAQELRQATYWGPFIRTMQDISNYSYWSTTGIFSPLNTRRMMDIEFISEISIAVLHGHQNKKETLDKFYLEYEEEFEQKEELTTIFQKVIFELEQMYPDIKNTRWRKKTDFYSLFTFLATKLDRFPLDENSRTTVRQFLDEFSTNVSKFLATDETEQEDFSEDVREYAKSIRASSDLGNRKRRHVALENLLKVIFLQEQITQTIVPIAARQDGLFDVNGSDDN